MKDRLLYGGIESDQCLQTENLVGWSNKEDATTWNVGKGSSVREIDFARWNNQQGTEP